MLKLFFFLSILGSTTFAQTAMFRGGPNHLGVQAGNGPLLGEKEWMFTATGPIRSTAVASHSLVYFGCSDGNLFALDKKTGRQQWRFKSGGAINSSPALHKNLIYFSDNSQTVYALNSVSGKIQWKFQFGTGLDYPWAFDYFYSSPCIVNGFLLTGSKDGHLYCLQASTGQLVWKFKTAGIVRSTPASDDGAVYVGDTEGMLYAVNLKDGKERWRFAITGNSLNNEDFGFDRRAIISSPTVTGDRILVGGRDGFLYAINKHGSLLWKADHSVSWVISSVAVKDSVVVTGTSDGRFVQAVHLSDGRELWKFRTISIVWSSPLIHGNKVYIGSQEGVLYCLSLQDGKLLSEFQSSGRIFASPIIEDSLLYFGNDQGHFYALGPTVPLQSSPARKFVYWESNTPLYFRGGTDVKIREYLTARGFKQLNSSGLQRILSATDSANSVIVFASNYFPSEIIAGNHNSPLRKYLDGGGKIVMLGIPPVIFRTDSAKNIVGRDFLMTDSVFSLRYGPNDLRSFRGYHPAFPTVEGRAWGLRSFWVSPMSITPEQVSLILGRDENGLASAWVKKYHPSASSGLVQIWIDPDGKEDLSEIVRVAEHGF